MLCRRVKVDVASHSPQVELLRDDLLHGLARLTPVPTRVPMYSTVTGAPIDGTQLDAGYWIKNLRETVKFSSAVQRLLVDECDVFVEISPHPILLAAIEQNAGARRPVLLLPSLRRQEPERAVMLESLGALYVHGCAVDWKRLYPSGGRCVGLPSYPWTRERFWYPTSPTGGRRLLGTGAHPLFEQHITSSTDPGIHFWQGSTDPVRAPWLMEYRVDGLSLLPASAIVEMALAAGRALLGAGACRVEDVHLESPLMVDEAAPRTMQLVVSVLLPGSGAFRLSSRDMGADVFAPWTVHATGTVRTDPAAEETRPAMAEPAMMPDALPGKDHYEAMRRRGLDYGPSFRGIVGVARRGPSTFVRLRATDTVRCEPAQYEIHPCLLDACLQGVIVALDGGPRGKNVPYVPSGIGRVILHGRPSGEGELWCRVVIREETPDGEIVADVVVADGEDHVLIEVTNVRLVPLARKPGDDLANQVFEIGWRPRSRPASRLPRHSGRWVILADRRGVGEALAAQLAARGARCSLISRGVRLEAGRNGSAVDPTNLRDHEALVAFDAADPVEGVVHLWGLDAPRLDLEPQSAETVTEALAIQGLVDLVKALVPGRTARSPRIVLVTAGTQEAAGGQGRVAIEQAPLWGVGAVIASEHPDLRCVRIDLSSEPTVEEIEGLAGECQEPDGEVQIALRGSSRYVARLVRVMSPAPLVGELVALHAEATYLITGGLGALGLTVAGALVDAGARHLALIGRRPPSDVARRAIAELARRGVDVVTMEADVTSPERMTAVLDTLRREKPPLRGVIHAAGVLDDATLLRLGRDQIRTVMAPKAAGAFMLHVLTQRDPLDFFVMFSSASALLGLGGQANYAGANAFLDALARHRHRLGQTALSIGWGPWSDIGLAAVSDDRGKRLEALGLGSLTPQQGAEAFTRTLGSSRAHIAVMEFDAAAWATGRGNDADPFLDELSAPTPANDGGERGPSLAEALRVASATERPDMLLRHVREQVATVLRFAEPESIDVARGFFTLGMDSLMAIELRNRLQAALERPLPSTVVFDRPSITQLAGYLGREILGWEESSMTASVPEQDPVDAEEIRRLPRHELQALLAEELKQLKDLG